MKRTIEVNIDPEPNELADAFWELDQLKQVEFFNQLATIDGWQFALQLQAIVDNKELTSAARNVMRMIGEYGDETAPADERSSDDSQKFYIGQKVHFTGSYGEIENGIVKSIAEMYEGLYAVHVVYRCNTNWDNYQNYTSELTAVADLADGWSDLARNVGTTIGATA